MNTISVSNLKANLSAELKKVKHGSRLIVLDHKQPVAALVPVEAEPMFAREAASAYTYKLLAPLIAVNPDEKLAWERADRW